SMELLIIIAIIWIYLKWVKSDDATRQKYKDKATETYNRLLIEAQKAQTTANKNRDQWDNEDRDYLSEIAPIRSYKAPNLNPDGPTVERRTRLFGPNFDD
ncbi:MAG: hypothetical protein AAF569_06750, partial [Pseudomonadota bacterium]